MSQSRTPTKEYKKSKRENAVLEVSQIEIGDPVFLPQSIFFIQVV